MRESFPIGLRSMSEKYLPKVNIIVHFQSLFLSCDKTHLFNRLLKGMKCYHIQSKLLKLI